jgi:hypothetical protein
MRIHAPLRGPTYSAVRQRRPDSKARHSARGPAMTYPTIPNPIPPRPEQPTPQPPQPEIPPRDPDSPNAPKPNPDLPPMPPGTAALKLRASPFRRLELAAAASACGPGRSSMPPRRTAPARTTFGLLGQGRSRNRVLAFAAQGVGSCARAFGR